MSREDTFETYVEITTSSPINDAELDRILESFTHPIDIYSQIRRIELEQNINKVAQKAADDWYYNKYLKYRSNYQK